MLIIGWVFKQRTGFFYFAKNFVFSMLFDLHFLLERWNGFAFIFLFCMHVLVIWWFFSVLWCCKGQKYVMERHYQKNNCNGVDQVLVKSFDMVIWSRLHIYKKPNFRNFQTRSEKLKFRSFTIGFRPKHCFLI